ncbi:hypothetical protein [Mycobacteroides abscessus]|uniref:hypothetical protein n=1 Tax=Mycobacteroides abscessus TaxID=36809 RepID=UPI001A988FA3|nr:hypothetical protein [Mycobacteroides abscessus]
MILCDVVQAGHWPHRTDRDICANKRHDQWLAQSHRKQSTDSCHRQNDGHRWERMYFHDLPLNAVHCGQVRPVGADALLSRWGGYEFHGIIGIGAQRAGSIEKDVQRDCAFQPGQGRAQAEVGAAVFAILCVLSRQQTIESPEVVC